MAGAAAKTGTAEEAASLNPAPARSAILDGLTHPELGTRTLRKRSGADDPRVTAMNLAERLFIGIAVASGLSLCGAIWMIG